MDKRFQKGRTSRRTEPLTAVRGLDVLRKMKYLIAFIVFLFPLADSSACECEKLTVDEAFELADVVFFGKVIFSELFRDKNEVERGRYIFEVKGHFKGKKHPVETVLAPVDSGICGIRFRIADYYLIFADNSGGFFNRELTTDMCKGNRGYGQRAGWPLEVKILRDRLDGVD